MNLILKETASIQAWRSFLLPTGRSNAACREIAVPARKYSVMLPSDAAVAEAVHRNNCHNLSVGFKIS